MTTRLVAAICGILATAASVSAQTRVWINLGEPAIAPGIRTNHAIAFDEARGVTVLFGGQDSQGQRTDQTWTWDGTSWANVSPTVSPTPRSAHAMAYDAVRRVVVLVGGGTATGESLETWEWNGATWADRTGANSLPWGTNFSMCYHVARQRVVAYRDGRTFEWDGSAWREDLNTINRPPTNRDTGMAYDGARGQAILFGGRVTNAPDETWALSNAWIRQTSQTTAPFGRTDPLLAFDTARGVVLMRGGSGFSDMWEWNGMGWRQVVQVGTPDVVSRSSMAYDSRRQRVVLFGGTTAGGVASGEIFECSDATDASYELLGAGCGGSRPQGAPQLATAPALGPLPWIDSVFALRLSNLPAFQAAFGIVGSSTTTWNGLPLPLALESFGMETCTLFASADVIETIGTASASGDAIWSLRIPNSTALVGSPFHQQALVFAPGANTMGVLFTNAGSGVIGIR